MTISRISLSTGSKFYVRTILVLSFALALVVSYGVQAPPVANAIAVGVNFSLSPTLGVTPGQSLTATFSIVSVPGPGVSPPQPDWCDVTLAGVTRRLDLMGSTSAGGSITIPAPNTSGAYSATGYCSFYPWGGGGNSPPVSPSSIAVTVGSGGGPPPVTTCTITASPNPVASGQVTTLDWDTGPTATACTASGSWSGPKAILFGAQAVGPFAGPAALDFILTCAGPKNTPDAVCADQVTVLSPALAPTVDIQVEEPIGSGTYIDGPGLRSVPEDAILRWQVTSNFLLGTTQCVASGDWSGSKPATLSWSSGTRPAYTARGLYSYAIACSNDGFVSRGSDSVDVQVDISTTSPAALSVNLTSNPPGGPAPLTVDLTANVAGTPSFPITYEFDCLNDGLPYNTSTAALGTSYTDFGVCTYSVPGFYTAFVNITDSGGNTASDTVNIAVGVGPDLEILTDAVSSAPLAPNSTVTFSAEITNTGSGDAMGAFSNTFEIDLNSTVFIMPDVSLAPDPTLPGLVSLATSSVISGSWNTVLGIHMLRVCADAPGSAISEADETNNCRDTQIIVSAGHVVTIRANGSSIPITVIEGSPVTIDWTTVNAPNSCTASGGDAGWAGPQNSAGGSYITPPLVVAASPYTYTIQCSGSLGVSLPDSIIVNVNPAVPLVDLQVNGLDAPPAAADGSTLSVSWTATGAATCTASGGSAGWFGGKSNIGGLELRGPLAGPAVYTYILACDNMTGTSFDSVTITISPPNPPAVPANPSPADGATNVSIFTNLGWSVSAGASDYDVYFGTCAAGPAYIRNTLVNAWNLPTLSYNTNYCWYIIANNAGGSTVGPTWQFVTIPPAAPNCAISASRTVLLKGQGVDVVWNCTSSGGILSTILNAVPPPPNNVGVSQQSITPQTFVPSSTTVYQVTATNAGGVGSASVTVDVYLTKIREVLPKF